MPSPMMESSLKRLGSTRPALTSARRWLRRADTEWALHEDAVDPAAVLPADRGQRAERSEAERLMQTDRPLVARVADDGYHLPEAVRGAAIDQGGEERAADAVALCLRCDID